MVIVEMRTVRKPPVTRAKKTTIQTNRETNMSKRFTMIYWKGEKFWLGKLLEHPEIMAQGETMEELEDK